MAALKLDWQWVWQIQTRQRQNTTGKCWQSPVLIIVSKISKPKCSQNGSMPRHFIWAERTHTEVKQLTTERVHFLIYASHLQSRMHNMHFGNCAPLTYSLHHPNKRFRFSQINMSGFRFVWSNWLKKIGSKIWTQNLGYKGYIDYILWQKHLRESCQPHTHKRGALGRRKGTAQRNETAKVEHQQTGGMSEERPQEVQVKEHDRFWSNRSQLQSVWLDNPKNSCGTVHTYLSDHWRKYLWCSWLWSNTPIQSNTM